ncbi:MULTISPECIES: hypothetical protein [Sphingobacterium]|uniref:hypothetical protein n=1 Tax=Sphingobacterium TaxID=28453 RepID=UPI0011F3F7C2|nr:MULTISPECIES: hypothetical protein [Sphingobacterium]
MTERITEFLLENYLSDGCSKAEMKRVEEYVNSVEGKLHLDEYLDKVWEAASKERVDEDVLDECRGLFLMEVAKENHFEERNGRK